MSTPSSTIRVFVQIKEEPVFAGEEVEATIVFKNVESPRPLNTPTRTRPLPATHSRQPSVTSEAPSRPPHSRQPSVASRVTHTQRNVASSHRQTNSLNVLESSPARQRPPASSGVAAHGSKSSKHGRSVSIISLGSDVDGPTSAGKAAQPGQRDPSRPGFKLSRSASVQIAPPSSGPNRWYPRAGSRSPISPLTAPIPHAPSGFPWGQPGGVNGSAGHWRAESVNYVEKAPRKELTRTPSSRAPPSSFRFPPSPSATPGPPTSAYHEHNAASGFASTQTETPPLTEPRFISHVSRTPPLNKVFSLSSNTGTPRTSTDIYSSSNHSEETMSSEYGPQPSSRLRGRPGSLWQPSHSGHIPKKKTPEILMMGFAQLNGSFTLDGSLVSQTPFEDVKRKAVLGGQGGGGVVGIEKPKADRGFFGGFNWSSLGESLGGFLGTGGQSSIHEMKAAIDSKNIPLISTPKSILFVDLKLAPGESKGYKYRHPLPRGLPPSHKGRAMKVTYNLVIGTQRPASKSSRHQQIRQVEVPVRVFGGVNSHGEFLGHDLMSPYIILRDQGQTEALQGQQNLKDTANACNNKSASLSESPSSSEADFNSYVTTLLSRPRKDSSFNLVSPSADIKTPRTASMGPEGFPNLPPLPMRTLVDNAIRMSSHSFSLSSGSTSQTQFTIARAGRPVAHLSLSRAALRLGDLLHFVIDLSHLSDPLTAARHSERPPPPVHSLTLSLESAETIEPSLAIRSSSSVERATRRVWDKRSVGDANGSALGWCQRWAGSLKVPSSTSVTPAFVTTGVSVVWMVRCEISIGFETRPRSAPKDDDIREDKGLLEDGEQDAQGEEVSHDEISTAGVGESEEAQTSVKQDTRRLNNDSRHKRAATQIKINLTGVNNQKHPMLESTRSARAEQLLERTAEDERGTHLTARRRLACESFEIVVPIKVFGASAVSGMDRRHSRGGIDGDGSRSEGMSI